MYLGVYLVLCSAILSGFATIAQKSSLNSDLTFPGDAAIEGSGNDGEVTPDLESSGSGYGPDDEDTPVVNVKPEVRGGKPAGAGYGPDDEDSPYDFKPNNVDYPVEASENNYDQEISPKIHHEDADTANKQPLPTQPVTFSPDVTMNKSDSSRPSFFAQPGFLAAVIGGAVVGLLCAILVVMFIVYRMRKKDEGSYALGEPKQSPTANSYSRGTSKEFYA